jgi:hypothetical protein
VPEQGGGFVVVGGDDGVVGLEQVDMVLLAARIHLEVEKACIRVAVTEPGDV